MEPSSLCAQEKTFHLQKDEFALSKDLTVSLWIDYRTYYGESSIREVSGGDFVIINEDLHDEFNKFKSKLSSYLFLTLDGTCSVVEGIELLMFWRTSSNISTKPLQLLEKTYFLMSALDLDNFCQWVYDTRKLCLDRDITCLLSFNGEHAITHSPCLKVVNEEKVDTISYLPVCRDWQENRCIQLGLKFLHGNRNHCMQPTMIGISQAPLAVGRIKGDGNCFFRSIAQTLTGSQEDHDEIRLLITSFMLHNATLPTLTCLLHSNESMEDYMQRTRMQSLNVWATEVEIIAAATMLHTAICVFAPSGGTYKWLKHSPVISKDSHQDESIFITNIGNHFETVKKM